MSDRNKIVRELEHMAGIINQYTDMLSVDCDSWVILDALELLKEQETDSELLDKALETLVGMEFDIPCDQMFDSGWCEERCNFDHPQKECWKKYLERFREDVHEQN